MRNRIVFFSGGLSSFAVAHYLKTSFPEDNIVLYFTDTKWEDEDLYRFILEVSGKLELPLLIHSMGIDPVQLMIKQKILFNSRMGNCSTFLKMKVASDYIKKGILPNQENWINMHFLKSKDFLDNPVLYFGISFDEFHRTKAIELNWDPFDVEFPLCKTFFDYDELLKHYNIAKPRLYLKGFTHNNCKGRCVKAGKGHWKLLYNEDRELFDQTEKIERNLSAYVSTYHELKGIPEHEETLKQNEREMNRWHDDKYIGEPNITTVKSDRHYSFLKNSSLTEIKREMDQGMKLNLFEEIGGCGCFVDYETEEIT